MLEKIFKRQDSNEVRLEVPVADFIPYACHFDNNTILTKNGELLQVLKVVGFAREHNSNIEGDLRKAIRSAITSNIKNSNYSLWFHTIRRKNDLRLESGFNDYISKSIDNSWNKKNNWDSQYINEVYVTILYDGIAADLSDKDVLKKSFFFGSLKKYHKESLESVSKTLNKVVDNITVMLKDYGAKKLSVYEQNGVFYSEILQFFGKILNLAESPIPMPINDISSHIATHAIAFGFNTMEVRGATGKHFGAVFTLKEYREIPADALDKFLQLPYEFIVSQTLDFINSKSALKSFKEQYELLKMSGDSNLSRVSGLEEIMQSDKGKETDFGESQINIFLISDSLQLLEKQVLEAMESLRSLGVVATRRDIRMEECYWSQLPGNFAFISRKRPINSSHTAGFASLYNFPAGKRFGNKWGEAVTILRTIQNSPYFFNFHVDDVGHTLIMGPKGSGKSVITNFLVSEAAKYNTNLYIFDMYHTSEGFILGRGGRYFDISADKTRENISINPFNLPDNPENRKFLANWLSLACISAGYRPTSEEEAFFGQLIDYLYSLPPEQRMLESIAPSIEKSHKIKKLLSHLYGNGEYSHILRGGDLNFTGAVGFNMDDSSRDEKLLVPILSYLLYHIETKLDGKPTIIVLDEVWSIINNEIFSTFIADIMDKYTKKNAIIIFATSQAETIEKSAVSSVIAKKLATKIFLPDFDASEKKRVYKKIWQLTDEEFMELLTLNVDKKQFMLQQGGNLIISNIDLSDVRELSLLSGSEKAARIVREALKEKGNNPKDWLPLFYENIQKN